MAYRRLQAIDSPVMAYRRLQAETASSPSGMQMPSESSESNFEMEPLQNSQPLMLLPLLPRLAQASYVQFESSVTVSPSQPLHVHVVTSPAFDPYDETEA